MLVIDVFLDSEKDAPERLRKHAEENPEVRDVLLQKASVQEQKNSVLTNKDEYVQILDQVDEVLTNVEKELTSHAEGKCMITILNLRDSF